MENGSPICEALPDGGGGGGGGGLEVKSADECASDDPCTAGDSRLCVQFMDPLDENSEVNSAVLQYCVRSNDWWSASNPLMDIDPMFPAQACQNHDACPGTRSVTKTPISASPVMQLGTSLPVMIRATAALV